MLLRSSNWLAHRLRAYASLDCSNDPRAPSLAHRGHIGWNYLYVSQRKDKNVLKARIKEITDTRVHYDYRIYLLRYDTERDSLKEIIEDRDEDYATITRSLVTNVTVSGRCARCIPASSATKTWPSA